jgi:hypothetical protein
LPSALHESCARSLTHHFKVLMAPVQRLLWGHCRGGELLHLDSQSITFVVVLLMPSAQTLCARPILLTFFGACTRVNVSGFVGNASTQASIKRRRRGFNSSCRGQRRVLWKKLQTARLAWSVSVATHVTNAAYLRVPYECGC